MKSLDKILENAVEPLEVAGTARVKQGQLRSDLAKLDKDLRTMFWLAAIMIFATFVLEFGIALANINTPSVLVAVGSAMGLTIAGTIGAMRRLVAEMAEVRQFNILSGHLPPEQLLPVVMALKEHKRSARAKSRSNSKSSAKQEA